MPHGPYPMNRADLQLCSVSSLCRTCYDFDPWCICATTNNNLPCFPVGHETKLQFCWVHFHVVVFHQRLLDLAQHISLRSCIQACHVSLRLQTSGGMFTVWPWHAFVTKGQGCYVTLPTKSWQQNFGGHYTFEQSSSIYQNRWIRLNMYRSSYI